MPNAVDIGPVDCSAGACSTDVMQAQGVSLGNGGAVTLVGEDGNGKKTVNGVGTFSRQGSVISFSAEKGSVGQVSVDYQIKDDADTSVAKVTFNYHNSAPVADGGGDSIPASTAKHYQMTGHDADGDPIVFLFDSVSGPVDPGPLFTFHPDGSFDFAGGPAGTWEVKFRVSDGSPDVSTQVVYTITTT